MNLLSFHWHRQETPPDKYRYTFPSGYVVKTDDRAEWFLAIHKHAKDNDLTLPENWKLLAEDQLCRVLPPGMCRYGDGSVPVNTVDIRMTPDDFIHGMEILARVTAEKIKTTVGLGHDPIVDEATAEDRASTCAACPANVSISGCSTCANVADEIVKINGGRKTKSEAVLRHCAVCHCSNRAQVWVKEELLSRGVTQQMHEQFQTLPWCWKRHVQPKA